ncbi:hypothetical protein RD792_007921 [Penstemon davidsonii]|uniref:EF-hand domain-containing protein n=1 Tax=Penstemon davidsonii TaxID=160366 RepID=A0ABR0D9G4_9LAMI|nr:hypothetical protein RD792_007921 [Penstemon davidsonii]
MKLKKQKNEIGRNNGGEAASVGGDQNGDEVLPFRWPGKLPLTHFSLFDFAVSGVLKSKENAQVKVSFGVGVYAGSTVFNLTLLWGMCVIFGRKDFSAKPASSNGYGLIAKLKDTGITIDKKTCYTAGIMLLSLIPYVIVQLTYFVDSSFGTRMVILIALVVSTALLLSYFFYQIFDPWIQERSLEYSKYENLLAGFLHHVQRHAKGKLIDESGQPNIPVLKGLFHETDKDADKCITFLELENLIHEIQSGKVQVEKDYAISEILKAFDLNKNGRIEEHEFIKGCTKWINEASHLAANRNSTSDDNSLREASRMKLLIHPLRASLMYQGEGEGRWVGDLLCREGRGEVGGWAVVNHRLGEGLRHYCLGSSLARLYALPAPAHLFKKFDTDNSNSLSLSELEELISSVKFGESQQNYQEMVKKLVKDFDIDGDNIINEQEFIHGVTKWLIKTIDVTKCKDIKRSIEEFDKIMWGEVDDLVYEVGKNHEDAKLKILTWDLSKCVLQVVLGIAILTFLSGPLMNSIQQFSDAIGVPSFFISFVIVPVAMNARSAILAIFPASQKSSKTSSLTFSEVINVSLILSHTKFFLYDIYGGVVMNNVMGLSTLLAIIYIKGLKWDYSAEVLTILVTGGFSADSNKISSVWDQPSVHQTSDFDQQSGSGSEVIATVINALGVINAEEEGYL